MARADPGRRGATATSSPSASSRRATSRCRSTRARCATAAAALREAEVEAVAVCFLFSFLNPEHERRVKEILEEELPGVHLSISHEVVPQHREYERFSTTALDAYIGPKTSRYLRNMHTALRDVAPDTDFHLMASNGGTLTIDGAVSRPTQLLMSGPVAGIVGGIAAARSAGYRSVITLDVGGTSADIGVAPDAVVRMKHLYDTNLGGYEVMIPMVDLDTIGAGGGSLARVDAGGLLRVGPQSAGADPGPGLLRPRGHRARRDRRAGGARPHAPRRAPRGRSRARRRRRPRRGRRPRRSGSASTSRARRSASRRS